MRCRLTGVSGRPQQVLLDLLERAVAAALLIGLSPLLAALAVAIRVDSPGPILYRQRRAGLHGLPFVLLKLRTMTVGAEHHGLGWETHRDDPRLTRVGRLLRLTSLDELPQLVNVVRGEMAFVGPRPALPHQVESYTPRARRRLDLKPGLTGLAQVSGRNHLTWDQRIELDLWYVEHRSVWLDLRIVLRTPLVVLSGVGVYGPDGTVRDSIQTER
jgi:lipopolysaccharide/colanic/teichoic acid biosynthesis glycosyltransferase